MRWVGLWCFLVTSVMCARPISYPGGWTVIQSTAWDKTQMYLHYSPTARASLGIVTERLHEADAHALKAQYNYLIKRHNTYTSQFNLYAKAQAGVGFTQDKEYATGALVLAGDWESRNILVAYTALLDDIRGIRTAAFKHSFRVGMAPSPGGYSELSTWFILQADHYPAAAKKEHQFVLTPLLRFFKNVYLMELGINTNRAFVFNFIIRI